MKKFLSILLLALCLTGFVQSQSLFSGIIKYKPTVTGENASMIQSMLQTQSDYYISGSNILMHIEGGMMAAMGGDILVLGKKGQTYMIKHSDKKAFKFVNEDESKMVPSITKEEEIIEILGYKCQKYSIEIDGGQMGKMTQLVWAASDLKVDLGKAGGSQSEMGGLTAKGIDGIVLKSMTSMMGMTMINTAFEINPGTPAKSKFKIPKGYKIEEMDPKQLMNSMGGM